VLRTDPNQVLDASFLPDALLGRAQVLSRQGRHAEAQQVLKDAVTAGLNAEETTYRIALAQVLARAGELAKATGEADAAAKDPALVGRSFYALAAVHAVAAGKDPVQVGNAIRLLERARAAGYFHSRSMIERLKQDKDFKAIRSHEEFRRLLDALQKNP
jgi:hypothetical protein